MNSTHPMTVQMLLVTLSSRAPLICRIIGTMSLSSHYNSDKIGLSFELFPPRTAAGFESLRQHVVQLVRYEPDVITCTYGAGGSTRDTTLDVVDAVKRDHGLPVASHLTCVGATVDELRQTLDRAAARNVDHIVALRGDPPRGESEFRPVPGGLSFANELVALIRSEYPQFGIAVGGYPEVHQEQTDPQVDLKYLKQKVDAGADIVITQLFYSNEDFFDFRERYESVGITAPLIPGILPVINLGQIRRIASLCGAKLPAQFQSDLQRIPDDMEGQFQVGIEFAIRQTQELIDGGVPGLHFYVLNKSRAASAVLEAINWTSEFR